MLTGDQIAKIKEQTQTFRKAVERWRPLVAQWRRAVDGQETSPPDDVREEIAKISDSTEMLGLQSVLWQYVGRKKDGQQQYRTMCLELIQVLAGDPTPTAAECLARLALLSDHEDVRSAAAAGLKGRPRAQYVPLLLWALWSPIEIAEQHTVDGFGNLATRYVVEQEGPVADVSVSQTRPADTRSAAALRSSVEVTNRRIERNNARIVEALSQATGLDLGTEPGQWWKWWQDQHEDAFSGVQEAKSENDFSEASKSGSGSTKPVFQYDFTPAPGRPSDAPLISRSRTQPCRSAPQGGGMSAGSSFRWGAGWGYESRGERSPAGSHLTIHQYMYIWSGDPSNMAGWDRKWSQ